MLACMIDSSHPKPAARLARERRLHLLRMRVAALAVAIFVAVWVGLFVQLVSGDDPALAGDLAPVATQSADPAVVERRRLEQFGRRAVVVGAGRRHDRAVVSAVREVARRFACFGATVEVHVGGGSPTGTSAQVAAMVARGAAARACTGACRASIPAASCRC